MAGRIITVRHGKPALSRGVLISATGYGAWWDKYDESGLYPGQIPPTHLTHLAKNAAVVFSSIMPRAHETALALVAGEKPVEASPLFIEAPLPPPPWPDWMKLSPRLWGVISRLYWINGYGLPGMEDRAATWARVDEIIARLAAHTVEGDVVLCAHGYLNWMISRRMATHNWTCTEHRGGNKYWSWRLYQPVST
ncbi:MAG: histidine phosphatase family protein [Pseudomonadota bacterium]